jgi:hypothetical protein
MSTLRKNYEDQQQATEHSGSDCEEHAIIIVNSRQPITDGRGHLRGSVLEP